MKDLFPPRLCMWDELGNTLPQISKCIYKLRYNTKDHYRQHANYDTKYTQQTHRSCKLICHFIFSYFFRKQVPLDKVHRYIQYKRNGSSKQKWKNQMSHISQYLQHLFIFPQHHDQQCCKQNQLPDFPHIFLIQFHLIPSFIQYPVKSSISFAF